jgi:hypothetical protein
MYRVKGTPREAFVPPVTPRPAAGGEHAALATALEVLTR